MRMATMKNLLDAKGREVWSVAPGDVVFNAIRLMAEKRVGALPVLEAGRLVGIVSERDYARKVILQGRSSKDTPVRDIMTAQVYCVAPDDSIDIAMSVMTEKHIRHLPVMEDGRLAGIVSIGDLVKTLLEEKNFVIQQLESYIAS
jgi:CBS domain-containing protein